MRSTPESPNCSAGGSGTGGGDTSANWAACDTGRAAAELTATGRQARPRSVTTDIEARERSLTRDVTVFLIDGVYSTICVNTLHKHGLIVDSQPQLPLPLDRRSRGHNRAVPVTVTGQVSRPHLGRYLWPLTGGANIGGTEAINGLIELHRRIARGFGNLANYITRALLDTGGFRARLHPLLR